MFKVTDLCITPGGPNRVHELRVEGGRKQSFTFEYGKPLEMLETVARQLVPIVEGFEVLDEQGVRVLPTIPVTQGYGDKIALEDDQCVARFSELSLPALLNRAWVMPGGEGLTAKSKREDVIAFIQKTRTAQARARQGKPDNDADDMSPAEVAELAKIAA